MVFDNFHNVFGSGHKMSVVLSSEDNTLLKISEDSTSVDMNSIISIRNPFNHDLDAIVIKSIVSMVVKPSISEHGYTITGSLLNLTVKVLSYKCLFKQEGEKSLDEIEKSLSTFVDVLRRTLNDEYLAKGFKLPMPGIIKLDKLTEGSTLLSKNGYLLIEAEPKKKHHGPFVQ
jgi:hypothetical protein